MKILIIILLSMFFSLTANAQINKLIYIPIDDRPVSLQYPVDIVSASGYKIIVPQKKILAGQNKAGNPEELFKWLVKNAQDADAIVISADSLIYGGLVPSRLHNLSQEKIFASIEQLKKLKDKLPGVKIYCFSSFLRVPYLSHGNVEPHYYEEYSKMFFRIGELTDYLEKCGYNYLDYTELNNLIQLIPEEYYNDWTERRKKNLLANVKLASLAKENYFHYYAIGKDDNATFSQMHVEIREFQKLAGDISSAKMQIIPGIDQIGLLLLVRAINEATFKQPYVHSIYPEGLGPISIPLYSNQKISDSVNIQIHATGSLPTYDIEQSDVILFVNTATDGKNKEVTHPENIAFASLANKDFVKQIKQHGQYKKPIALADVAYANGADNGFMLEMCRQAAIADLSTYSAWNTADNSIGYAIATGILVPKMNKMQRERILQTRFLDDWFYQANVRATLKTMLLEDNINIFSIPPQYNKLVTQKLNEQLQNFNREHNNLVNKNFTALLPWQRLFEVQITYK